MCARLIPPVLTHRLRGTRRLYDAIVAGAGPAGNIAALRLAQAGHRVLVVDWRQNLGDKLCTGIIGRECVERFPPDESHIYASARSATVVSPSGKAHRVENGKPQAYIVDRVAYVTSFASKAQEQGAEYRLGERVVEIDPADAGVTVTTSSESGETTYNAKTIVVSSGFASPLVRMVGLADEAGGDHMIGAQAEVTAEGIDDTQVFLGDGVAPGSFGWLVPLSDSRALAGVVSRQKLNGHMDHFVSGLREQGKVGSVTKEPARWGIPIRPIAKTYDNRVLVAGDAAGFVKPTTGGGIYYALLSGEVAAQTIEGAVRSNDFSGQRMSAYESSWKALFGSEIRTGYYARRLYEVLGDDQIERLLDRFLAPAVQEEFLSSPDFSFDWHSATILKAVAHKELGKLFKSFGPVVLPFLSRVTATGSR